MGITMLGTSLTRDWCPNCHIEQAFPIALYEKRLKDHANIYCPNGHSWHYTAKSEEEKLREQLNFANQEKERQAREKRTIQTQLYATRGQLTKVMNRVKNGVCPKCNRQFSDLHEHMKSKHTEKKI